MSSEIYREHLYNNVPIPAAQLFQHALKQETYMPSVLSESVKSTQDLHGDGDPGTIKQITFQGQGYMKLRVDVVDHENFRLVYTCFEGEPWNDLLEEVSFEFNIVPSSETESNLTIANKYYAKEGCTLEEEQIKDIDQTITGISKTLQAHLVTLPNN